MSLAVDRLRNGAKSVAYEIARFAELCAYSPRTDVAIGNSILEAFLLHFRCLREFFQGVRLGRGAADPDDVLAVDFADSWSGVERPEAERKRLNKWLSHISYSRVESSERESWPTQEMAKYIVTEYQRFRNLVRAEFKPWFPTLVASVESIAIPNQSGLASHYD